MDNPKSVFQEWLELLESAKKFIADLDNAVYNQIVWAMHLRPESKESMDHRLSDKKD